MWELYDALIEGIPAGLRVERAVCGWSRAVVTTELGAGLGAVLEGETRPPTAAEALEGAPLRDAAALIRSWNFPEAALGLAAVNAYYNAPEIARAAGVPLPDARHGEDRVNDPFIMSQNLVRGKKVCVVGHFPYLETLFEPVCDLSIVEWEPEEDGDYPFSAGEALIPESEVVFLSARSLVDKTFPRLLELSRGASHVVLVGPITPLAPLLLEAGIDDLSGFVIREPETALALACGSRRGKIYTAGQKVSLRRAER